MPRDNSRVLVVDDSAVTRLMICDRIAAAAGLSVAGSACNGREALAAIACAAPGRGHTRPAKCPTWTAWRFSMSVLDRQSAPCDHGQCDDAGGRRRHAWRPWTAARPTTWPSPQPGGSVWAFHRRTDSQDPHCSRHGHSAYDCSTRKAESPQKQDAPRPGGRQAGGRTTVLPSWPACASHWAFPRAGRRRLTALLEVAAASHAADCGRPAHAAAVYRPAGRAAELDLGACRSAKPSMGDLLATKLRVHCTRWDSTWSCRGEARRSGPWFATANR